ncbi:uncharacterized protein A4U43_C02F11960 [Asparagus officinalis]|uniref:Leucine-rich repeat-containing N-terminal plant-type domain-containing protein n=1 Tax=Asparagus officinalis TaxID=4686 RepID=A0A5P1FJK0_ASPOF|nr:uncharacterized protein A4U43_C02F11960 [Asparagus officinalis]
MGIQVTALLLLGLAFPSLMSCNIGGDILHAQRITWTNPNNAVQSWEPTLVNPCSWFHVTCNGDNSVIRLDLGNAQLSGPLIPRLGELENLQYLELNGNKLSGVLPIQVLNLATTGSLEILNVSDNSLAGTLKSSHYRVTSIIQDQSSRTSVPSEGE